MIKNTKTMLSILWIILLVSVSSAGFYIIGGEEWTILDSLFMTLITLATVGFQEIHPLTEIGRIWTILVILFGASSFAYFISQFGSELLQFNQYRRKKMLKQANKLTNHFIICGFGRMGAVIANELHDKRYSFIVIENNCDKIKMLEEIGYLFVDGDATLEGTLIQAGIERAKGAVVVLNTDQDNLFVSMSIRTLNSELFLISRCSVNDTQSKLKRAGVNKIVNPYVAGGHKMSELLLTPELEDSVTIETPQQDSVEYGIDEIPMSNLNEFKGKTIRNCQIREKYGLLIVGLIEADGKVLVNPVSEEVLKEDQTIMVIGSKDDLDELKKSV